ncbi:hypothetical protein KJ910_05105 [Patescibacteria group bacterium]|nr:hypothetical protein [Patescibacteria group bacterium]MBU1906567.1 hypothetical protein [Patescibacteria group bacterium]
MKISATCLACVLQSIYGMTKVLIQDDEIEVIWPQGYDYDHDLRVVLLVDDEGVEVISNNARSEDDARYETLSETLSEFHEAAWKGPDLLLEWFEQEPKLGVSD